MVKVETKIKWSSILNTVGSLVHTYHNRKNAEGSFFLNVKMVELFDIYLQNPLFESWLNITFDILSENCVVHLLNRAM